MKTALPDFMPFPVGERAHPLRKKFHDLFTHYYVITQGVEGGPTAIGEAREVKRIGRQKWRATIARWGVNILTNQIDPDVVWGLERQTIVCGPVFVLVPKKQFDGVIPIPPRS